MLECPVREHRVFLCPCVPEYFSRPWIFRYEVTEGGANDKIMACISPAFGIADFVDSLTS